MTVHLETLTERGAPALAVVFPHAGGSPRFFASWSSSLSGSFDLAGMTYPGRDALLDVPPATGIRSLAVDCAAELEPSVRARPVVLFGHSMGAYVAFETARLLEGAGLPVAGLVAGGADAPSRETDERWHLASDIELADHIGALDPKSRAVLAQPALARIFLPTIRADYRLVETYRADPGSTVSCSTVVVCGDSDPEVTPDGIARWTAHAPGDCRFRFASGGHFDLVAEPFEVYRCLDEVLGTRVG
ncbi:thioesterase II family protein [Nocardia paucivorans]|uniref:thioesterase II family protein n=1 Tax=Nocardia paucivorans TaxID=114259 RepID=UPI0002ED19E2|nr:alpha/beta fold hydrolase [Nocardia paucivorans]